MPTPPGSPRWRPTPPAGGPLEQVAVLRDFHLADGEDHYRRLRELLPGHDIVVLHGIHALAHAAVLDADLPWAHGDLRPGPAADAQRPSAGHAEPRSVQPAGVGDARPDARADRAAGRRDPVARRKRAAWAAALPGSLTTDSIFVACSPAIIRVPPDCRPARSSPAAGSTTRPVSPLPSDLEAFLGDGARRS